jgi:hypothetical protein
LHAKIQKGSSGQFDVVVDGETFASKSRGLLSKLIGSEWPDPDAVVKNLRERAAG